jgi:hypothetical protein
MSFIYRNRIAIILAIIKFLLPFILQHPMYLLHRDEFLYLEEGNYLAWGFMEVPPLLAVFAKASLLMGGRFFWIKFWPSLFGALNVYLVCQLVRQMGGRRFAEFIAGFAMIAGVYLRVHFLFQPNPLEIFFWTLALYFLVRLINTNNNKYLYYLFISLAVSWYSKYSVAFLILGIAVGALVTPNRKWFTNKHLYLAALLALIIISPNVLWQYYHKWPVVHHMKELRETQLQYISPKDFLIKQVLMHITACFVCFGGLVWLLFSKAAKVYRILGFVFCTVIVLLAASNAKDYYSLGVYPMLYAAGGVWIERISEGKRRWLRYAAVAFIVLLFVPLIPLLLPVWEPQQLATYYKKTGIEKTGALNWEDLKTHPIPQDFADMLGWKELGEKVSKIYTAMPDTTKKNTLIFCRFYGLAGPVIYYEKGLGQVTNDNSSFLFWMPDKYNIKHLLFVGPMPKKDDAVFQQFEKVSIVDSMTTPFARERGTKIILYENGNDKVNAMIETGIKEKKDEFRR